MIQLRGALLSFAVAVGCFCSVGQSIAVEPTPSALPWKPQQLWKGGAHFNLSVQMWPAAPTDGRGDATPITYSVQVMVPTNDQVGGFPCWRLLFLPGKDAPPAIGGRYNLCIDQETGWSRKVDRFNQRADAVIERFADVTLIDNAPIGFPLEFLPAVDSREIALDDRPTTLTLQTAIDGDTFHLQATVKVRGVEEMRVRQTWVRGEKWWRESERFVHGRKDLYAQWTEAPDPTPPPELTKPPPPLEDSPFYLRLDSRLQGLLSITAENPSLDELLVRLRSTTGIELTLDQALANHQPKFGSIQLKNAKAWSLMELIERTQLADGHWDKVAGGYRLTGTSIVPPPPALRRDPSAGFRSWLTGGSLVVITAVGCWFAYRRFRKKPVSSHG